MSGDTPGAELVFHYLYRHSEPGESLAFLRSRHYRAVIAPGVDGEGMGIVAQRDMETPIVATVGSTLVYDPATGLVTVQ